MIILGLTGSIGMGKSTTAEMFKKQGIPVYDADAIVHRLYEKEAVPLIERAFPGTTTSNGVNREILGNKVIGNEAAMKRLEEIVHPLVLKEKDRFLEKARSDGQSLVVLDNPLLFEMGSSGEVDGIIVVTAPKDIQRQRVLARAGMDEARFKAILERQFPDREKRKQADFIIDTSLGMENAAKRVAEIIKTVSATGWQPATGNKKQD